MSYCFNCGNKVSENDSFCGHCGTSLVEEQTSAKSNNIPLRYGYLLTNIDALTLKLNIPRTSVTSIINGFIDGKKSAGVAYELIDVSDYRPRLPENGKHIKLSPVEGWQTHQRLLMDCYFYDVNQKKKDVLYLFIVGGHDIIPMSSITHYFDLDEKIIETDMPYSYLYGSRTQEMLENATMFLQPQMLFTGRLPLPEDATYQMLNNYLHRAVDISISGLRLTIAYGQCDPHWKRVSALVTQDLRACNLFPEYGFSHPDYIHESLFITPQVTLNNIDNFFNPQSSLYYFNMHGSNYPHQSGFTGAGLVDEEHSDGISPAQLAMADSDNVVVTEACYGAKFIGRKRHESMLLSALYNKTILYLGSSRTSYGAVDGNPDYPVGGSNADIIAYVFIQSLLRGYDAGSALYLARREVLYDEDINPMHFTTVAEFNVFGDPTLNLMGSQEMAKTSSKSVAQESFLTQPEKTGLQVKKVYDHQKEQSILSMVRDAVNSNIKQINETINTHLYSHYNIRPRQLESVFTVTYAGGKKSFLYQYDDACGKIYVATDEKHKITKVVTSKIY